MGSFTIRRAVSADGADVAAVKFYSWRDTYRGIISDSYLETMSLEELTATWQKILSAQNTRNFTDVMTNTQGNIIGYVSHALRKNDELNTDGEIMALYLLKEYHGKGLGARLFTHSMEVLKAKGVQSFCLSVLTQNPALHFYRKFKPGREVEIKVKIGDSEYDETTMVWSSF